MTMIVGTRRRLCQTTVRKCRRGTITFGRNSQDSGNQQSHKPDSQLAKVAKVFVTVDLSSQKKVLASASRNGGHAN
jgi:hypothetical protein